MMEGAKESRREAFPVKKPFDAQIDCGRLLLYAYQLQAHTGIPMPWVNDQTDT